MTKLSKLTAPQIDEKLWELFGKPRSTKSIKYWYKKMMDLKNV